MALNHSASLPKSLLAHKLPYLPVAEPFWLGEAVPENLSSLEDLVPLANVVLNIPHLAVLVHPPGIGNLADVLHVHLPVFGLIVHSRQRPEHEAVVFKINQPAGEGSLLCYPSAGHPSLGAELPVPEPLVPAFRLAGAYLPAWMRSPASRHRLLPHDAMLVFNGNFFNESWICNVDASDWLVKECSPLVVVAGEVPALAILLHVPDLAGLQMMEDRYVPVKGFVIPSTLKDDMHCLTHLGAKSLVPDFLVLLLRRTGTLYPATSAVHLE